MSQWGWSVPSWVNNSHRDFWLGMCPWSQKMGDSSAAVVAFHLCQPYCINARWPLRKISMWGFQLITQKCVLVDNWICVIWITVDHSNISEQLKIQYQLLNGMCKLKYGRIGLNWVSFRDCLKICKMLMHLMFTVEAPNLAQNCTR